MAGPQNLKLLNLQIDMIIRKKALLLNDIYLIIYVLMIFVATTPYINFDPD